MIGVEEEKITVDVYICWLVADSKMKSGQYADFAISLTD